MLWAVPSLDRGSLGGRHGVGAGPPVTGGETEAQAVVPCRVTSSSQLLRPAPRLSQPPEPPKSLPEEEPGAPFSAQEADGLPSMIINKRPRKPFFPESHNRPRLHREGEG